MPAKTLMIMGTGSSVGKSLLTAALCRIYRRRGLRVAPFKAQNMSNNAAVCPCGAEIGRAQALQARAAGIEPSADMNPVLLKPEGHTRSQVIVLGKRTETLEAARYYERKTALWPIVTAALDRLRAQYDLVLIEGAGSPVELNLQSSDIVNMAIARYAKSPVLLVGDIDKGGIFAQMLGTLWLLPAGDRALVRGLIVNKFRGDRALFADGVRILQERGEVPVLGVVPFLADLGLPEEDAVVLDERRHTHPLIPDPSPPVGRGANLNPLTPNPSPPVGRGANLNALTPNPSPPVGRGGDAGGELDIAVIRSPHIANFDDFDPLQAEPGVRLRYVQSVGELGQPAAVILPGTKTTMSDLAWLRDRGFDRAITDIAEKGTAVVGICGGYQMLGTWIRDPVGVESAPASMPGLGLLPIETVFEAAKITRQVSAVVIGGPAWLGSLDGTRLTGYEIHMGRTSGGAAWLRISSDGEHADGAMAPGGRVWGCYLHGLFANDAFRHAWLNSLRSGRTGGPAYDLDAALERLADAVDQALDMGRVDEWIA